jgi:hypothetical protein
MNMDLLRHIEGNPTPPDDTLEQIEGCKRKNPRTLLTHACRLKEERWWKGRHMAIGRSLIAGPRRALKRASGIGYR